MRKLLVSIFICMAFAVSSMAMVDAHLRVSDPDAFIYAIVMVENPWLDPHRVGDRSLYYKAFGLLQARKPYLDDVNRIVGPHMMMKMWGKARLTIVDMKDKTKAVWVTKVYLVYYGKEYESDTGKRVTPEIYARIHNGGPEGWRKWTTISYWHKVKQRMPESFVVKNEEGDMDTVNSREI
jgi:hypothetical protein